MKIEGMKQANMLVNWLEANDVAIADMTLILTLSNNKQISVHADGSMNKIDDTTDSGKAYANASSLIKSMNYAKDGNDMHKKQAFKIVVSLSKIKIATGIAPTFDEAKKMFSAMSDIKQEGDKLIMTYNGDASEEPDTVSHDFKMKYNVSPDKVEKA